MKIIKKGITTNNEQIQIEDWSKDYSFISYGSIIGAYPISKQTLNGVFLPKLNERFRFQIEFDSHDEALQAFNKLKNGECELIDYKEKFKGKKELLSCL